MPTQRRLARALALMISSGAALGPGGAAASASNPTAQVNALEGLFGKHAGFRRSQAKGVCVSGYFQGTREGAALTKAVAFSGKQHPVLARFSVGGGNPAATDKSKSTRGLVWCSVCTFPLWTPSEESSWRREHAKMGRPAKPLVVSAQDRAQLEAMARSQALPAALARRAQMILPMADGESNSAVAWRYCTSRPTVTLWRTRFRERGIAGLHDELKPGRPRSTSDEQVARLIRTAIKRKPPPPIRSSPSSNDYVKFQAEHHTSRLVRISPLPLTFSSSPDISAREKRRAS